MHQLPSVVGAIHQIHRREAGGRGHARRSYHPDQIYDPFNPWAPRRTSTQGTTEVPRYVAQMIEIEEEVVKKYSESNPVQGAERSYVQTDPVTSQTEKADEQRETSAFSIQGETVVQVSERAPERHSTQRRRTYFPVKEEEWTTQRSDRRRPTRHWPSRANGVSGKSQTSSERMFEVTKFQRLTTGSYQEMEQSTTPTQDTKKQPMTEWRPSTTKQQPSVAPNLETWKTTLMERRGRMPPTFGSSFYKDKDLRLGGEEEDEEYRVAEGSLALRERAPPLPPCMTLFLPFPTVFACYQLTS